MGSPVKSILSHGRIIGPLIEQIHVFCCYFPKLSLTLYPPMPVVGACLMALLAFFFPIFLYNTWVLVHMQGGCFYIRFCKASSFHPSLRKRERLKHALVSSCLKHHSLTMRPSLLHAPVRPFHGTLPGSMENVESGFLMALLIQKMLLYHISAHRHSSRSTEISHGMIGKSYRKLETLLQIYNSTRFISSTLAGYALEHFISTSCLLPCP